MRTKIFAVAAFTLACTPLLANAGFEIDPGLAKTLAPKPQEPAVPAAVTTPAKEPASDPIAKMANSHAPSPAAGASVATSTTATSASASPAIVGGPIAPAPVPIRQWQILAKDLTIQSALRRWAKEANWQLSWDVPIDYPATLTGTFTGSFEEATEKVLSAYRNGEFPLQGCFYDANSVLRVTRFVENSRDCE